MKRKRFRGFTLIELVIVLLIISILLAVALPSINTYRNKAQNTADDMNMLALKEAATMYCIDTGWENVTTISADNLKDYLENTKIQVSDENGAKNKAEELLKKYKIEVDTTNKNITITKTGNK
ncbi:type II secretion system protein [uncultured Ezakiella sp.]|uniref:type II secretion system protein n=1 Tax=uncultured Ezakiella sp. TaxID=1637529 RepID=UPI0025E59D90|nr:prepilin-type N-terminal cleavage/methylation domain-containing protein [uncultured Ezakiella sp.]